MVSTRHHPKPFPEPTLAPSRSPTKDTSPSSSSSPTKTSPPPSPTVEVSQPKRTPARRSARKSTNDDSPTTAVVTSTRSRARTRSQTQNHIYRHHPSSLLITWLIPSLVLVLWDTAYVLGRPHTMPGGRYHSPIWTPYALYGTIDYMYGWPAWNNNIGFTAAQASLNVVETLMYTYYLYVVFSGVADGWKHGVIDKLWREGTRGRMAVEGPNVATAVLVCWAAALMSLSKTILYMLNEAYSHFEGVGHNDASSLLFLWIIPNGAWIVFPIIMVYVLGKEMISAMHIAGESGEKED